MIGQILAVLISKVELVVFLVKPGKLVGHILWRMEASTGTQGTSQLRRVVSYMCALTEKVSQENRCQW